METTNENIRILLEMLDNPDAYSEQEIRDIINRNEDTRETYRLMTEAKRSRRHCQDNKPVDIDAAWQRFCTTAYPAEQHKSQVSILYPRFRKIAASIVGVLLVSGIAFAAIHIVSQYQKQKPPMTEAADTTAAANSSPFTLHSSLAEDTIAIEPVTYDNIPLEKMLPEIAAHYNVRVTFLSDEARGLRFRFVWNPQQGIGQVISDLNQFERLTVTLNDNEMTIK